MAKPQRTLHLEGLEIKVLQAGAFYQCLQPGGFSDSLTGIHIPGPKALINGSARREIVGLSDIPDPIQLPHVKVVTEYDETKKITKEVEVDFCATDKQPVHEAFQLALSTGILRLVPDEVMEDKYPDTWAKRIENLKWRANNTKQERPIEEMFAEAERAGTFAPKEAVEAKAAIQERNAQLDAPAAGKPTPPPPPPPRG